MKILSRQQQDVPNSLFCDKPGSACGRIERINDKPAQWCSLYNRYLDRGYGNNIIKCHECIEDLRTELLRR